MKHIKEFESIDESLEQLNEKISIKQIILSLAILYSTYNIKTSYNKYSEIKQLYTIVNSSEYNPTGEEKELVERIKSKLIKIVEQSSTFDKHNKGYILDSLRKVTIKIAKPTGESFLTKNNAAIFLKLGAFEENLKKSSTLYKLIDFKSSKENVILVNKDYIHDEDIADIIAHEIFHYVDNLLSNDGKCISDKLNLSKFVDKKLHDENYAFSKLRIIMAGNIVKLKPEYADLIKKFSKINMSHINYYSESTEIFARWKILKLTMVTTHYIKDMNDKVNYNILYKYIQSEHLTEQDRELLFTIDWHRIEEFDKLTM